MKCPELPLCSFLALLFGWGLDYGFAFDIKIKYGRFYAFFWVAVFCRVKENSNRIYHQ